MLTCIKYYLLCLTVLFSEYVVSQHEFTFQPVFGTDSLQFGSQYVSINNDTITFSLIKLYVSNFEVKYTDGSVFKESNSYHLIEWSSDKIGTQVMLSLDSSKKAQSISYNLGVDSTTNTAGALDGDLDPALGMYWAWKTGYINFKIEGRSSSCDTHYNEFAFHVGGYRHPHKTVRPITHQLDSRTKQIIYIDLSNFIGQFNLHKTHSVLMPGLMANDAATTFSKCFKIR